MQEYELDEFKRDFKKLYNKNFDDDLAAFISYVNSIKLDNIKFLLVQLSQQIKDKSI